MYYIGYIRKYVSEKFTPWDTALSGFSESPNKTTLPFFLPSSIALFQFHVFTQGKSEVRSNPRSMKARRNDRSQKLTYLQYFLRVQYPLWTVCVPKSGPKELQTWYSISIRKQKEEMENNYVRMTFLKEAANTFKFCKNSLQLFLLNFFLFNRKSLRSKLKSVQNIWNRCIVW